MIELEAYFQNKACIVSFYGKNFGNENNKYRIRIGLGPGQVRALFKACIEAYLEKCKGYGFIFHAEDDIGKISNSENDRMSAYKLFLESNFPEFNSYNWRGSLKLNTYIIYPRDHPNIKQLNSLYNQFEEKVSKIIEKRP